jgi:hypothetical protein
MKRIVHDPGEKEHLAQLGSFPPMPILEIRARDLVDRAIDQQFFKSAKNSSIADSVVAHEVTNRIAECF